MQLKLRRISALDRLRMRLIDSLTAAALRRALAERDYSRTGNPDYLLAVRRAVREMVEVEAALVEYEEFLRTF